VIAEEPLERTARVIMNTLPVDKERKISYATFSMLDINYENRVKVLEYGNPPAFIVRNGQIYNLKRDEIEGMSLHKIKGKICYSHFNAIEEDRLIVFSDGISQSGIGSLTMPFGWPEEEIGKFVLHCIAENPQISSSELADRILKKAIYNDGMKLKDDASCLVAYFRNPRKMVIASGPPFDPHKDHELAEYLAAYPGTKVLSGGTTAQIISRELKTELNVDLNSFKGHLPPESKMEGFDLITEGILTIGRLVTLLETYEPNQKIEDSAAGNLFKLILHHDRIEIIVGTKINEAHQDPSLPVELEIRRNVFKRIATLLEHSYLKEVEIKYI